MTLRRFAIAFTLILASALAALGAGPEVEFDETVFDFGTVRESAAPVQTVFVMTNKGPVPVAILSASTTCGCSKAEYPTKPVEPGKTAKIKVKFNPAGKHGEINREIKLRIKAAGGKSRRIPLRIRGNVIPAD